LPWRLVRVSCHREYSHNGWPALAWLILAFAACEGDANGDVPEGWSRVEVAGEFSLALPPKLKAVPTAGADSLVHRFRGEGLTISIDYGRYSNPLTNLSGNDLVRNVVRVDGRSAELVTLEETDESAGLVYTAALHVPEVGRPRVKFTLVAQAASEEARDRGVLVAMSLRFTAPAESGTAE
jgi:hypothetical protein